MDILKKVVFFYFRLLFHCLIRELTGTYGFVTAMRDS